MQIRFYSLRGVELFARVTETIRYRCYVVYLVSLCNKIYAVLDNQAIIESNMDADINSLKLQVINELKN